ncbi:iron chaperone [Vagococcus silagei]|uniref:YdhG-like domain-containing protein n=1 Tax=Vagococcus silagei TaxID=2508885 RepID=A0A4S3B745_9ENTE|nr:DUF1801 domain-containing protein [Vagococcus silagei]THB62257.1 hypothetical protein ESZ54_00125 [Vagococcus silagei]
MSLTTVDQYLETCPQERLPILNQVRQTIKEALPDAEECIKYGIPTYYQQQNLVHFSNAKTHLGFYPTPEGIIHFAKQFSPYKTSKGAVQFPFNQEIPYDLIREVSLWRLTEVKKGL